MAQYPNKEKVAMSKKDVISATLKYITNLRREYFMTWLHCPFVHARGPRRYRRVHCLGVKINKDKGENNHRLGIVREK